MRFASDLNVCGIDVWFDQWEIRVGDDLHARISDAIEKCRYVAVLVGNTFQESRWIAGEVHHALTREKNENRVVVLPLLIDNAQPPPVLAMKKYLSIAPDDYYTSLVSVAGLVHGISPSNLASALQACQLRNLRDSIGCLRYSGFDPPCVADRSILEEVERAGGIRRGEVVSFDAYTILTTGSVSPAAEALLLRLAEVWNTD